MTLEQRCEQMPMYSSRKAEYLIQCREDLLPWSPLPTELWKAFETARDAARITHEPLASQILSRCPEGRQLDAYDHELHHGKNSHEWGDLISGAAALWHHLTGQGVLFVSEYTFSGAGRCFICEYARIEPSEKNLVLKIKERDISINPEFLYAIGEKFGSKTA